MVPGGACTIISQGERRYCRAHRCTFTWISGIFVDHGLWNLNMGSLHHELGIQMGILTDLHMCYTCIIPGTGMLGDINALLYELQEYLETGTN